MGSVPSEQPQSADSLFQKPAKLARWVFMKELPPQLPKPRPRKPPIANPAPSIQGSKRAGSAGSRIAGDFMELFMMNSSRNPRRLNNPLSKIGRNQIH